MPQFLRLVNEQDGAAQIRNGIRDQMILPEQSRVSLVDCNVRFNGAVGGESFTVQDETMSYTINADTVNVTMPENYTSLSSFQDGVVNNLNYQCNVDRFLDWDYDVNEGQITLKMAEVNITSAGFNTQGRVTGTATTADARDLTAAGDEAVRYLSNNHLTRGQWRLVGTYDDTDADCRYGAILDSDSIDGGGTFIGVYAPGVVGNYTLRYNNTDILDLGYAPALDDAILINLQGSALQIEIADATGGVQVSQTYTLTNIVGVTDSLLQTYKWLHFIDLDGTGTAGATGGFIQCDVTELRNDNIAANTVTLVFSRALASYLGYKSLSNRKTASANNYVLFPADDKVAGDKTSQGILVTLEGVGRVGSFDGPSGTTCDVIAVIPETANIVGTNDVVHTTPYKYGLELNNATPIRVNNLVVRFRTRLDENPLQLRSGSMVTLLFE